MGNARPPKPPTAAARDEIERSFLLLETLRDDAHAAADDAVAARASVEACIKALSGLRAVCDGIAEDPDAHPSFQQQERRVLLAVVDAAFIAQCDLRPLLRHFDAQQRGVGRDLIDSACRKVRRACNRVLAQLGPVVGSAAHSDSFSQSVLETSLAVRRHYARFRRSLPRVDTTPQSVRSALSATLDLVVDVMRHVDASDIRIQDEMVFKTLQHRTEMWLTMAQSPEAGRQLFTDVCAFAGELRRVSDRRELREHDANCIDNVLSVLDSAPINVDAITTRLRALEGMDDRLDSLTDRLARDRAPATLHGLRERLLAMRPPPRQSRQS